MREIKFRARALSYGTNDWVYFTIDGILNSHNFDRNDFGQVYQYTGLKDSQQKEIYEGDILISNNDKHRLAWVISFNDGKYGVNNVFQGKIKNEFYPVEQADLSYRRIIGNIYENPELLNGSVNEKKFCLDHSAEVLRKLWQK